MRRLATLAAPVLMLGLASCMPQFQKGPPPSVYPLYFQDFSAKLDTEGEQVVKSAADFAIAHPDYKIVVLGYADPTTGSQASNLYISKTRAQVVTDQLVTDGVPAARIKQDALGATPFAFNGLESRRVEIDIAPN